MPRSRNWCYLRLGNNFWWCLIIEWWRQQLALLVEKTCYLFLNVSNWQFHHSLAHLGFLKNLVCSSNAFSRVMLRLKYQMGVALILQHFWWNFVPREGKVSFPVNSGVSEVTTSFLHIWLKSTKTTSNVFESVILWETAIV